MNDQNNTQAALDFARKTTEPRILLAEFEGATEQVIITTGATGEALITPVVDLFADRARAPQRRKGTIITHDLKSFIAVTNRDSDDGSVIFADMGQRKVTAILDFHGFGRGAPRWGQDRVEYGFTLSQQLQAWLTAARNPMDQKTFAKLIDDRIGDVADEPPVPGSLAHEFARRRGIGFASVADLLVFTRTIVTKSTQDASEMFDENTGNTSIQFTKRNDVKTPDGQPVAVPAAFALSIPILCGLGATVFTIAVRLRYDISEKNGITWRVELNALDQYVLAAIEACLVIVRQPQPSGAVPDTELPAPKSADPLLAAGCGLPVFMGAAPPPA